jgi:hypothetical protein
MAYLPKNKYEVLYTNGGEFINLSTNKVYKGKYLKLTNGKFFAGENPQSLQGELTLIVPNFGKNIITAFKNNKIYSVLKPKLALKQGNFKSIPSSTPIPTPLDYNNGSFTRYLVIRKNTKTFQEISKETYENFSKDLYDKNLYSAFSIKWSLKENNEEINLKNLLHYNAKIKGINDFFKDKGQYGLRNGIIFIKGGSNKRLYPSGEFIDENLPVAYQLGNTDVQGNKINNRVPSYQFCGNCVFAQNGKCNKWDAGIKKQYWCAAWETKVGS